MFGGIGARANEYLKIKHEAKDYPVVEVTAEELDAICGDKSGIKHGRIAATMGGDVIKDGKRYRVKKVAP